jgi:hypothetical protein
VYRDTLFCGAGHGQHLTGLGHVKDLATAMAQVIGREQAKGQVYNIQVRAYVMYVCVDTLGVHLRMCALVPAGALGAGADVTPHLVLRSTRKRSRSMVWCAWLPRPPARVSGGSIEAPTHTLATPPPRLLHGMAATFWELRNTHSLTCGRWVPSRGPQHTPSSAEAKIVHYDPKKFDFGKKKAFPMRPQHFFTSAQKAMRVSQCTVPTRALPPTHPLVHPRTDSAT